MYGLVFGYAQLPNGKIDAQTKGRCKKAVQLYYDGKISKIFLTVSAKKNEILMADAMADYLEGQGILREDILVDPRGGNTAGEMDVFLSNVSGQVVFISTWYHIPRIMLLALWRIPKQRFTCGAAWTTVHFIGDFLMEFLKMANAILRPLKCSKTLTSPPT